MPRAGRTRQPPPNLPEPTAAPGQAGAGPPRRDATGLPARAEPAGCRNGTIDPMAISLRHLAREGIRSRGREL
ncbi:hypothetical protein Aros01_06584 [Streptosporangium roseum]|uniref:Uncharacterized protein n=1 Tax=Streptosporangium roseum (strain ATCC 12428 / DSM 43021 / JCM 3005 / KCTC 9067 / NCIMB 10171 / NRRL 2505 / NI 9100) TaxID=479432 RepID=D2BD55_STRRD|nr:hypothetical protein Sros_1298 [Streptosporangium roseum DSM 43021]